MKLLITCMILILSITCYSQRIGVQGSSSANGQGLTIADSSWPMLVKKYYKNLGKIDTLYKLAASTMNVYHGMPGGWNGDAMYVPPTGRNVPNTNYNCSRLIYKSPGLTHVIISYPSTLYDIMTVKEVVERFQDLRSYYANKGVIAYVATTQPRNDWWIFTFENRKKLRHIADTMLQVFGNFAIDFYYPLVHPAPESDNTNYGTLDVQYRIAGDAIHPNVLGHRILYQQVIAKNILSGTNALPVRIINFRTKVIRRS